MDNCICAEITDKLTHPRLYASVMAHMIHGPCGAINKKSPCMDNNHCTKKYPREFVAATDITENGYPTYRRRITGIQHILKRGNRQFEVDNRWVVPYNPWLLLKYDCHINLEFCASITTVKYIFKYVYKGHDCSVLEIRSGTYQQFEERDEPRLEWDEISNFLNTRYVSAPEASWRISKFPL